jgi:GNAT superfamily N-acetyltransferase
MKVNHMHNIHLVKDNKQILKCFAVMHQLRPNIPGTVFLQRVRLQMREGYQMVYLLDHGKITAVAGFRIMNNLAWGKFLYVDDLVTDSANRSKGYGSILLNWLFNEAKKNKCTQLHLDSGVQRSQAHRFYKRENMDLTSYHFARKI